MHRRLLNSCHIESSAFIYIYMKWSWLYVATETIIHGKLLWFHSSLIVCNVWSFHSNSIYNFIRTFIWISMEWRSKWLTEGGGYSCSRWCSSCIEDGDKQAFYNIYLFKENLSLPLLVVVVVLGLALVLPFQNGSGLFSINSSSSSYFLYKILFVFFLKRLAGTNHYILRTHGFSEDIK